MKSYRYVDGTYEITYEIKRSKFIATVSGELDGDGAEAFVKSIKKKYSDATHNCYAYIGDMAGQATRFSDDGEPSGTAGQPILEVLRKRGLVKTAVVVTRYFGGIKLGAGGLVSAYTESAVQAITSAVTAEKVECGCVAVSADYTTFATIDAYLRKNCLLSEDTVYGEGVTANIWTEKDGVSALVDAIMELTAGRALCNVLSEKTQYRKLV